jgi:predicted nucleic acid-binding Zn ribbon protein
MECLFCGKGFEPRRAGQKYCSDQCRERAQDRRQTPRKGLAGYQVEKACTVCGQSFLSRTKNPARERYCSTKCRVKFGNQAHYAKIRKSPERERTCVICRKQFEPVKWRPEQQTCSIACNNERQNKIRRGMREKNLGPRPCAECAEPFIPTLGKESVQICCSRICSTRRANRRRDEKSRKAGHKQLQRTRWHENRRIALERDKICQMCSATEFLVVHHKDGSGETKNPNHDPDNLTALCYRCHKAMHSINYRVVNGELFVTGKIFEIFGVDSVKVLKEANGQS